MLAVAPASLLAVAIADTYPTSPAAALAAASADGVVEAYDVDMSTGPLPTLASLGSLAALSLVGLDDRSVTRDASQSAIQIGPRSRTGLPPSAPRIVPERRFLRARAQRSLGRCSRDMVCGRRSG